MTGFKSLAVPSGKLYSHNSWTKTAIMHITHYQFCHFEIFIHQGNMHKTFWLLAKRWCKKLLLYTTSLWFFLTFVPVKLNCCWLLDSTDVGRKGTAKWNTSLYTTICRTPPRPYSDLKAAQSLIQHVPYFVRTLKGVPKYHNFVHIMTMFLAV